MSNQVETHRVEQFSSGIEMLAQQLTEKLRRAVRIMPMQSKKKSFDQIGLIKLQPRGARHADLPTVETPHKRRWVTATRFRARDFIDEADVVQVLNDPTNGYTEAFAAGAAREFDIQTVQGMLRTNYTGEEGTTAVELPTAQKIAVGGTGFTLDKLKKGVRILKANHAIMPGDELHCAWTAKQEEEFINTTEVKSSDFTMVRVLDQGGVETFYRVQFHMLDDIEDADDGRILPKTGTTRSCPLWVKSGVVVGLRQDAYGRVAWLDERESWQVSGGIDLGGTRAQEKKVVQIDVVEA